MLGLGQASAMAALAISGFVIGNRVPFSKLPRAGIEPATQGFSVLCSTD